MREVDRSGTGGLSLSRPLISIGVALVTATVVLLGIAIWLSLIERERDIAGWEGRLRIVADSRRSAVDQWLDRNKAELRALAENVSLQLYMTELQEAGGQRDRVAEEAAQAAYLRNLLMVTADRSGFQSRSIGPQVEANVRRTGTAGLALLDRRFNVLVSTPLMPPIDDELKAFLAAQPTNRPFNRDVYLGVAGTPTMAFVAPVFAVQADAATSQSIGFVIGVREIENDLSPLLQQPGVAEATAEGLLLQRKTNTIEVISPRLDGTKTLQLVIRMESRDSIEAKAAAMPGSFVKGRDYRNQEALGVSRSLSHPSWVLLYKIDRNEALAESDARRRNMLIALLLLAVGVDLGFVAVWRHASSKRAANMATRLRDLADQFEAQGSLLRLVADHQPDSIVLMDAPGHIQFLNHAAAVRAGLPAEELIDKPFASVFGPDEWRRIDRLNHEAMTSGLTRKTTDRLPRADGERIIECIHIPVRSAGGSTSRILVIERDVTDILVSRERHALALRQLVEALVALVDRRDPHASQHSAHVAAVCRLIAEELQLDPAHADAAEIAGRLMNLGKILVSPELLTKAGALTDAEREEIRSAMLSGADIISGIDFDGPVEESLRQIYERWDGSGVPKGLSGEAIILPARVVAVANAFVGMISSRSWRRGISTREAVDEILAQAGHAFDRRVAIALANIIENHKDKIPWAFSAPPA